MIAIPNMEKPKGCRYCRFVGDDDGTCRADADLRYVGDYANAFQSKPDDCPLIDIVTCGECEYWHDHEWSSTCDKNIGHGFPSDYFCANGKRRSE